MRKKLWICLALMLVIPGLLFMTSCAKKAGGPGEQVVEPPPPPPPPPTGTGTETGDTGEPQEKLEIEPVDPGVNIAREKEEARRTFLNEYVYFDFDKATLTEASQELLKRKAGWLEENPSNVTISGHCDERGTVEYNMVLGAERAEAVKNFLVNLGIPASSMNTISRGEDFPVDSGSNEEAWAKNRRAVCELN